MVAVAVVVHFLVLVAVGVDLQHTQQSLPEDANPQIQTDFLATSVPLRPRFPIFVSKKTTAVVVLRE